MFISKTNYSISPSNTDILESDWLNHFLTFYISWEYHWWQCPFIVQHPPAGNLSFPTLHALIPPIAFPIIWKSYKEDGKCSRNKKSCIHFSGSPFSLSTCTNSKLMQILFKNKKGLHLSPASWAPWMQGWIVCLTTSPLHPEWLGPHNSNRICSSTLQKCIIGKTWSTQCLQETGARHSDIIFTF